MLAPDAKTVIESEQRADRRRPLTHVLVELAVYQKGIFILSITEHNSAQGYAQREIW
jgi:hypothetical protein